MSRLSIAILVLIVVGFIMTVKRDEPEYPNTQPTVAVHDKGQKPGPSAEKNKKPVAGQPVAHLPPKSQPATTPTVAPTTAPVAPTPAPTPQVAPPAGIQGSVPPVSPPQKQEEKTAQKGQGGLVEQQVAGNTPTSAPAGIIESGENLGRETQRELTRLGCFSGAVTERWGKEGRAAIKRFNLASRYSWDDWPNPDLLASLKRYPEGYCKKCRSGGGDCEIVDNQPDKGTAPAAKPDTKPAEKNPVIAVAPPAPTPPAAVTPPPAPVTPPVTQKTPVLDNTPAPAAKVDEAKEKNEGERLASRPEGMAGENNLPYLPPSAQGKKNQEDDQADETPKKKKSIVARTNPDEDPDEKDPPKRKRRGPVEHDRPAAKPKPAPRPVVRYYEPRPRYYSGGGYSSGGGGGGGRSSWDARPQGVGR